jgi:aryl-alcohol dehydrogenase-like predicted oxidoreductase
MIPLVVEWRHLAVGGETCERCGSTGANVRAAVEAMGPVLAAQGITLVLREVELPPGEIAHSNEVLVDGTPIEETWSELMRLVDEGKVRHCGISNHPVEAVERALGVGPVAALQYQYSLLHREPERDILPLASSRGLGVLTWGPLASGFLADGFEIDSLDPDDFRRTHAFADLELEPLRRVLRTIGERRGRSAAQVALGWVLAQPAVAGAIVGIRSAREAEELPGAADLALDPDELRALESALP